MFSTFKYSIILIVSTYYILCISWILKCLIVNLFICRLFKYTVNYLDHTERDELQDGPTQLSAFQFIRIGKDIEESGSGFL